MQGQRSTDPAPATYLRSERVTSVSGHYFFCTREGTLEGPYFSRYDTEREVDIYIRRMRQAEDPQTLCSS